jgi:adenylyltransferase/sulfurtransferase
MTLADPDRVDLTNLHRQLWHQSADVGRLKVESAAEKLVQAFPSLRVAALAERVDAKNALELFRRHSLVIDATDGEAVKFLLSDAAVLSGVTLIYGGALRLGGQAMRITQGGPCLRCLFEGPSLGDGRSCAQAGVLGSVTGVVGAMQGMIALQPPSPIPDQEFLHLFDGAALSMRQVAVRRAPDCTACSPEARDRLSLSPVRAGGCDL